MRRLFLIAAVATLAVAKPGLYREKEDFQYSRSSTDEGSKSGFYGAQRGNMGGNYERAHNMDGLAQHQMSGLVKQVQGELGDGMKTRSGSVFTAANSRGVYGSGHYDLSNLEGRNFQEGVSYGDSQSLSQQSQSSAYNAHSSQAAYNAQSSQLAYNAQSALNSAAYRRAQNSRLQNGYNGYNGYQYSGQNGVEGNTQQAANLHTGNQYGYDGYDATGYYSQTGHNGQSAYGHSAYDQSASNLHSASLGSNAQTRLVSGMPVKVVLRPGTRVIVPIATETYDSTNSAAYNHNSVSATNSINQNSDAELISSQSNQNSVRPAGPKHYESAYSYHKEWEKHDTKPVTLIPVIPVPTASPFPKNSELYEDAQTLSTGQQYESTGAGAQSSHSQSSNIYSGYNANVNSASLSQSRQHSAYNNLHHSSSSGSDSAASLQAAQTSGSGLDTTNQIEGVNSKPKSYHSSYSYHKSWERQGDPYIIKPASTAYTAQASQRLTSASSKQGAWSSHGYGSNYQQAHQNVLNLEDCDDHGHIRVARSYNTNQFEEQNPFQQSQYNYDQESLNQQSQNLEDLGQQTQSQWDQLDVGQQTQSKWDKLEDVAQQSQGQWDKVEDLGQQTQNKWDKIEELGQQTQNSFDKIEDLGQQSQNKFDKIEDLGQQTQNKFDKIEDLGQQTQNTFDKIEDLGQQSQNQFDKIEDLGQQTQTQWDKFEEAGQQTQSKWDNFGQQAQLDGQQLQNTWDQLESGSYTGVGQETQKNWDKLNNAEQGKSTGSSLTNEESDLHKAMDTASIPTTVRNPLNINVQVERHNPNWEQSDKDSSPPSNYNNFNHRGFNPMLYVPQTNDQVQHGNYFNQQSHSYNAWNNHESSYSQSNSQNNWDQSFLNHGHTIETSPQNTAQDSSTLWNLWNKVDTIEKQTISSKNSSVESGTISESNFNSPTINGVNSWIPTVFTDKPSSSSTASTTRIEGTSTSSPTTKDYKQLQDKKLQPSDVERGDIGPEDTSDTSKVGKESGEALNDFGPKPTTGEFVTTSDHKQYKNPADIEAVSQVLVTDKPVSGITNNFNDKDNSQQQMQAKPKLWMSYPEFVIGEGGTRFVDKPTTQGNSQNSHAFIQQNEEKEKNVDLVQIHKINPQNGTSTGVLDNNNFVQNSQTTGRQYLNMGQDSGNTATVQIGQSNFDQSFGQQGEYVDQENLQQSEKFNQENLQQFDGFVQPGNIPHPQNTNIFKQDASTESLSPSNEHRQYPIERGTYTIPVIIVTKPKENINTGKSTSQEFETARSDTFGLNNNFDNQQSYNQNAQQFENIDNLYQQHTGQELESFQQQSNNFDQQNTDQQFEGFEQQNGKEELNMEQQFETLTQQLDTFDTHDTEQNNVNLSTQNKEVTSNLENTFKTPVIFDTQQTEQQFDHLNENFEGSAGLLHKVENIGVGSSYNKFRHTESLEQSNLGQTEDLGQQVQTSWEPSNIQSERTNLQETQHLEVIPVDEPVFKSKIIEDKAQKPQIIVETVPTTQHTSPIDTPPETEKPGFWKSVGNKFVSAKDKVFSWFGSG